jgi:hypothetical protein
MVKQTVEIYARIRPSRDGAEPSQLRAVGRFAPARYFEARLHLARAAARSYLVTTVSSTNVPCLSRIPHCANPFQVAKRAALLACRRRRVASK